MSKFWKVVIIIALVLVAMLLLTYASPAIKEYAQGLSVSSKLPLWLVGLAAPILYVFNQIGKLFTNLFGPGPTERGIRDTNEAVKAQLAQVEHDIEGLHEWRRAQIEPHLARIAQVEQRIGAMEGRAATLAQRVPQLEQGVQDATAERERAARELLQAIDPGGDIVVPAEENP